MKSMKSDLNTIQQEHGLTDKARQWSDLGPVKKNIMMTMMMMMTMMIVVFDWSLISMGTQLVCDGGCNHAAAASPSLPDTPSPRHKKIHWTLYNVVQFTIHNTCFHKHKQNTSLTPKVPITKDSLNIVHCTILHFTVFVQYSMSSICTVFSEQYTVFYESICTVFSEQ